MATVRYPVFDISPRYIYLPGLWSRLLFLARKWQMLNSRDLWFVQGPLHLTIRGQTRQDKQTLLNENDNVQKVWHAKNWHALKYLVHCNASIKRTLQNAVTRKEMEQTDVQNWIHFILTFGFSSGLLMKPDIMSLSAFATCKANPSFWILFQVILLYKYYTTKIYCNLS